MGGSTTKRRMDPALLFGSAMACKFRVRRNYCGHIVMYNTVLRELYLGNPVLSLVTKLWLN